jgi:hypothetical protein
MWFSQASVSFPMVPPSAGEGVFQVLDGLGGLGHGHLHAAQVLGLVVDRAPLAGLGVDDEHPAVGVGDVDVEGVVALGNGQGADFEVGIGVQLGGGVGSGAPDGIGGIVADLAVLGEEVAVAALDAGRAVGNGDGLAGDGGGFGGGGALGRGLGRGRLGGEGGCKR